MSLPVPHVTLSSEPCRVFQETDLGRSAVKACRRDDTSLVPHIWAEEGLEGAVPTNQIEMQVFPQVIKKSSFKMTVNVIKKKNNPELFSRLEIPPGRSLI
jgi:hypothetical protein